MTEKDSQVVNSISWEYSTNIPLSCRSLEWIPREVSWDKWGCVLLLFEWQPAESESPVRAETIAACGICYRTHSLLLDTPTKGAFATGHWSKGLTICLPFPIFHLEIRHRLLLNLWVSCSLSRWNFKYSHYVFWEWRLLNLLGLVDSILSL